MNKQSGNVLFLILIAVALFAALSYAVSGMMRPNTQDSSAEKVKTMRGQINDIEAGINSSIHRMILSGACQLRNPSGADGIAENTMNPANPAYASLTRHDCNVFDTRGGGVLMTWDSVDVNKIIINASKVDFASGAMTATRNINSTYIFVMDIVMSNTAGVDYGLFKTLCLQNNADVKLPLPTSLTGTEPAFAQILLSSQAACYINGAGDAHYVFPVGNTFEGP